jgi:hypothetical protein
MTPIQIPSSRPWYRPLLWSAVAILAAFIALPASAAAPDSSGTTTLAGLWKLDVKNSDSAQDKLQGMRRSGGRGSWEGGGRPHGGGMGGGGMRGGMGGGRPPRGAGEGPGEGGPGDRPRSPETRLMMQPPASLLIEQTDSTIVLIEKGLPIEVLVVGLPQGKASTVEPDVPHVTASWTGKSLLALREDERGGRATQEFTISADGKSFTLILRREPRDDRPAMELKREYRRDEG